MINYIISVSIFLCFIFWYLNFIFVAVSKILYFFYFGISTLFLLNSVSKPFAFYFYFGVLTLFLFN